MRERCESDARVLLMSWAALVTKKTKRMHLKGECQYIVIPTSAKSDLLMTVPNLTRITTQ